MSLKMSEFHGIEPNHVTALRAAGIENTDDLMGIWGDKEKRAGLVASTGIAEEHFTRFASMARLGRVKGIALQHLDVLVAAGISGPKRLFTYTPETLVKHLGEVAAERKLAGPVPTLQEITPWFENPKPEPTGKVVPNSVPEANPKPEEIVVK
jgi:hypothetical protein